MDLNRLRTSVFEKTGIRIDTNDPIFALVALNEAVLAECVEQQVATVDRASEKLAEQTRQLLEAGERHRKLLLQVASLTESGKPPALAAALGSQTGESNESESARGWISPQMLAGACVAALLTAALTLCGMWAFKDRFMPAPVIQKAAGPVAIAPPALTPEQLVLMRDGERFAKMWGKLDEANQARIQSLIDQP